MGKTPSRTGTFFATLGERLARSSRVFLISLLVACGIEVLVDWNQTLFEINVLRDQIRHKGLNYAGLLTRALDSAGTAPDRGALERLAAGILDDEDAIFVRITNGAHGVAFEKLDDEYVRDRQDRGGEPFLARYAYLLERDEKGITEDFEGFRSRLANSRYRDIAQSWTDTVSRLSARFVKPPPLHPARAQILYQDRLRDAQRQRDDSTTWALSPLGAAGNRGGAVIVAFDMSRTNAAIRGKYLKGLGMVIFFVGMILVQNILSRRDKLRLLDVERRYQDAKQAIASAVVKGKGEAANGVVVEGWLEQAHGTVDGMVWDVHAGSQGTLLLVGDPDGDGVEAAAIGLHLLKVFRARRAAQGDAPVDLRAEASALGAAALDIPLCRPIGLLLVHIASDGQLRAIGGELCTLLLADEGRVERPASQPLKDEVPRGLLGPLFAWSCTLAPGARLISACASRGVGGALIDGAALSQVMSRTGDVLPAEDLAIWLRGKNPALREHDLAVVIAQHRPGR